MRVNKTYDVNLLLKDAGLVAASAAAQVSATAKVIDMGLADFEADLIIDVSACEVDTGDEMYTISAQISSSSTFASDYYDIAAIKLGHATPLPGDTNMGAGRYVLGVQNRIGDGTPRRYLRVYTTVAGTIATGINYTAYLSKD